MWLIEADAVGEDLGEGFFAGAAAPRSGLAYQETPVIEPDYWTAKAAARPAVRAVGSRPHQRDPGGGRAVVDRHRRRRRGPAQGRPAPRAGRGGRPAPSSSISAARAGGSSHRRRPPLARPHPRQPVVAATTRDGRLVLVSLVDKRVRELAPVGARPRWNHDGIAPAGRGAWRCKPNASYLRVYVFKVARRSSRGRRLEARTRSSKLELEARSSKLEARSSKLEARGRSSRHEARSAVSDAVVSRRRFRRRHPRAGGTPALHASPMVAGLSSADVVDSTCSRRRIARLPATHGAPASRPGVVSGRGERARAHRRARRIVRLFSLATRLSASPAPRTASGRAAGAPRVWPRGRSGSGSP